MLLVQARGFPHNETFQLTLSAAITGEPAKSATTLATKIFLIIIDSPPLINTVWLVYIVETY